MVKLFAVYDKKAERYGNLTMFNTQGLAIRSFSEACLHDESEFKKHPQDYAFFEIGTYDDEKGIVIPLKGGAVEVCTAMEFVK